MAKIQYYNKTTHTVNADLGDRVVGIPPHSIVSVNEEHLDKVTKTVLSHYLIPFKERFGIEATITKDITEDVTKPKPKLENKAKQDSLIK